MLTRRILFNLRLLSQSQAFKSQTIDPIKLPHACFLSSKVNINRNIPQMETDPETGELKKKKSPIIPKITVLSGSDINITTLEDAQKLAKRRDLKLVKVIDLDTKTQRPVYRLMTGHEYHEEDLKQRERKKAEKQKGAIKGEKVLIVNQNISEHDLQTDVKKILKWLDKRYEVRMVINGNNENNKKAEDVYSFLESHLSGRGRIVQKRQKGSDIKFQVLPPKEPKNTSSSQDTGGSNKESPV